MISDITILDCTLRDGGYYTNWDFNKDLVEGYCKAMESLPIKYVEIGYRCMPIDGYLGEYFYCPEYLMKDLKRMMPNKKLAIILDEKNTNVEDLDILLDPCRPYIDLVRVAIAPDKFESAIALANKIKSKGFELAFNVMYMSKWEDDKDFLNNIFKIDGLVDYFYMVDSFGGVLPDAVKKTVELIRNRISSPLGFHGHNNMEMGLINSITAMESGCCIVDCTITGMGRGAGNLKTELLMTYLASKSQWEISFDVLSDVVSNFEDLQNKFCWGTNLPYMISGGYSLPQKEVMAWMSKRRYSISGIVNALKELVKSDNVCFPLLENSQKFNKALIIGGGESVVDNFKGIESYVLSQIKLGNIAIIHASTRYAYKFNDMDTSQFYCLAGNEGYRLQKVFQNLSLISHKCILPSIRTMGAYVPEDIKECTYILPQSDFTDLYHDSPLAIAIETAICFNVKEIEFIGFDGYDLNTNSLQYDIAKENQYLFDKLSKKNIPFCSLTPTIYQIKKSSLYKNI